MANTYLTMQTRIADELINSAVTTSHIKNAIQTAIAFYENTAFYFNQKVAGFTTVAGKELYGSEALAAIPNIFQIRTATIALNGVDGPLEEVDYEVIDDQQTGSYTGFPYWYVIFAQQIRLFPIPDNAYPITLSFVQQFTSLSADTDTNSWMNDGEELIRQRAKKIIALDVLSDDTMAGRASSLEKEAFDGLRMETTKRISNQKLNYPSMLQRTSYNIYTGR